MADVVRSVTRNSYGGRLQNSIKGVLIGIVLFIASFYVLWWNEGNFVKVSKGLGEGRNVVVPLDKAEVRSENEGKLVHVVGKTAVGGTPLVDPAFGIQSNSLLLERNVQMYQWTEDQKSETREHFGGSEETVTTYTYKKEWSSREVSSSDFHEQAGHQNPGPFPYKAEKQFASDATLGDFKLQSSTISKIDDKKTVPVADFDLTRVPNSKVNGEYIYIGNDPVNPVVGDMRISFTAVAPGIISVIAKQTGDTLQPYKTKTGSMIELVASGEKSADELFTAAEEANSLMTWTFRGLGLVMMWLGLMLIAGPLSMILAVIPGLRGLAEGAYGIAALLLTLVLGGGTIALAWLFYRPFVSIGIIVGAILLGFLVKKYLFKKKPQDNPAPAPAVVANPIAAVPPANATPIQQMPAPQAPAPTPPLVEQAPVYPPAPQQPPQDTTPRPPQPPSV